MVPEAGTSKPYIPTLFLTTHPKNTPKKGYAATLRFPLVRFRPVAFYRVSGLSLPGYAPAVPGRHAPDRRLSHLSLSRPVPACPANCACGVDRLTCASCIRAIQIPCVFASLCRFPIFWGFWSIEYLMPEYIKKHKLEMQGQLLRYITAFFPCASAKEWCLLAGRLSCSSARSLACS